MESGRCAAIVGLGLVGGSLARDLSARGVRVLAHDANAAAVDAAIAEGIVSEALEDTLSGASQADVIVIAVPVDCAVDVLRRIAPHASATALVTDVGSTKASIVAAAESLGIARQFVGSHPMAGDHRSGWDASRAGLFSNARVFVCATTGANEAVVERACAFWRSLRAHPVCIPAHEHDRKLASASHLPHVLSAALGIAIGRGGIERSELGPGGRDMTRLAGSSPDLWTAIARENAAALDAALAEVEHEIGEFRRALASPDRGALRGQFVAARAWFDAVL